MSLVFDKKSKKLCHKRLYQYFGENAPKQPWTLEQMQPLFEQVYHGCAAGLYQETYDKIFHAKIDKGQGFLIFRIGAWETELSLVRTFFPEGDISQIPLVTKKSSQGWLFNAAGLALLATGRPKEAEEAFLTCIKVAIEDKEWANASGGYDNLADLQFRMGEIESGIDSAEKALETAEKAREIYLMISKGYLGWMLYLVGKTRKAEKEFSQADKLSLKIERKRLLCAIGVFYADFLNSMNRNDEALELTKRNLELCQRNNYVNDISRIHCCFGAIERVKGNFKEAENHLQDALDIARKVDMPYLEIEAVLEYGRLRVDMGRYEDAIRDAENVLKLCGRMGFRFYEPGAEMVLAKAYLGLEDLEKAESNAKSAYEKAVGMKYRWAEGEAADLLGQIFSVRGDKAKGREWLKKAVVCRKEILDPKVKETEEKLKRIKD